MKNLYLIGCPRSGSTFVHALINVMVGGRYENVSAGEFLNPQRIFKPVTEEHSDYKKKLEKEDFTFWTKKHKKEQIKLLNHLEKLDQFFVIKDVIFPEVVSEYVKCKGSKALIIRRSIPMTAYCCAKNNWYYPTNMFGEGEIKDNKTLIKALIEMNKKFDELCKRDNVVSVSMEEVVEDEKVLPKKLNELGFSNKDTAVDIGYLKYEAVVNKKKEVEKYKKTKLYKEMEKIYNELEMA